MKYKKQILIVVTIFIAICVGIYIYSFMNSKTQIQDSRYFQGRNGKIYFRSYLDIIETYEQLSDIDHENFSLIGCNDKICAGTDENVVVMNQKTFLDSDPATFEFLGDIYAKDSKHFYCALPGDVKIIEQLDEGNLQLISPYDPDEWFSYAKDDNNVYQDIGVCEYILIPESDPETFEVNANSTWFSSDSNNVYYGGMIIPNSDPNSYRIFDCNGFRYDCRYEDQNQSLSPSQLYRMWLRYKE